MEEIKQKKEHPLLWLAIAMALNGRSCAVCGHLYDSRESVNAHEPVKGYDDDVVGRECWNKYIKSRGSK